MIKTKAFQSLLIWGVVLGVTTTEIKAQITGTNSSKQNTITTAVPFLMITPDARGGAMGDCGVAMPNDAHALHWNLSKIPFNDKKAAVTLSYTPWLRSLVPDISLAYMSGYAHINERSAVAASLRYFSLGQIQFTDQFGNSTGNYNPNELAVDIGYASKLSEHLSLGIAFRYIRSDLAGAFNQSQTPVQAGNAYAGDITSYYTNKAKLKIEGKKYQLNYGIGAAVTNIGSKISYTSQQFQNFIPINMRVGGYGQLELDKYNTIAVCVEFNKLLVPTSPKYEVDSSGVVVVKNGQRLISGGKNPDVPVIQGMLQSFSDAPGGMKEELQEINISGGIEYWYDKQFALRAGYFYESPYKGNRKFLTFGTGFRFNVVGIDVSYLVPIEQRNPLERTLRFSLLFDFDAFKSQNDENKPPVTE